MGIRVTGLDNFRHSVEGAKARLEKKVNERYRELVANVLTELALNTPQWSGDLAASWRVTAEGETTRVGGRAGKTGFKQVPHSARPSFFKGDYPAVEYALTANAGVISTIRYNTKVTIFNDNSTQSKISEDTLRPRNFIPGDIMAVEHVKYLFSSSGVR